MVELYNQREAVENYGKSQYVEGEASAKLADIKNLMNNLKMTLDQAMQALGIPADDQSKYRAML